MTRAVVLLVSAALTVSIGCSSGLGGGRPVASTSTSVNSTNLRYGFDPGMVLSDPIQEVDLAGGTLPGIGAGTDRPVVFLAFVTEARANNGDGVGTPLDRSTPPATDGAGTSDVFLAAISADQIDPRSFVDAIAGKMRHPRCVTCHSMNVTAASTTMGGPTTAFATSPHPGMALPVGTVANCGDCHLVDDWRAPADALDLRSLPAQALFTRAQQAINGPGGSSAHFETDSRVLWALGKDGGVLPFGNVADDDHDGIAEPEDTDGTSRTVPGGLTDFFARLNAWKESGQKFDSADAVQDITLVTRANGANSAGNGDSFSPSVHYRPNPAFTPGVSNPDAVPVGFVRVAYASDATNMVGGTANGATDVFIVDVNVFNRTSGSVDLVVNAGSQQLVSTGLVGDAQGSSTAPDLGGVNGQRVAFVSTATNLVAGFVNNNGAAPDVFVAEPGIGFKQLVSHLPGAPATGGNGASRSARIDPSGTIVVFESTASNLVAGDTNAVQDIFYADAFQFGFDVRRASVATGGLEAGGGDSSEPSVYVFPATTDVRIAYTSAKSNLVSGPLPGAQNVYLYDSRGASSTILLNRIAGPPGSARAFRSASQDAGHPIISADGESVLFESMSADIDFVRPGDDNKVMDVMLADLRLLDSDGFVLPYTLSVSSDGGVANGASHTPVISSLVPANDGFPLGVAAFRTAATNLSNPDVTGDANSDGVPDFDNLVLMFVKEGATVVADFKATPEKQGMGLGVRFESTSSGRPTQFTWDFGDGQTSTQASPIHVYTTPGVYTVSMEASGALGDDSRLREDYVRVLGPVDSMFRTTKDSTLAGVVQDPANDIPSGTTIRGAVDPAATPSLRFVADSSTSTECPDEFDWLLTEINPTTGQPMGTPVAVGTPDDPVAEVDLTTRGWYDLALQASGPGGQGASATQRIEVWNKAVSTFTNLTSLTGNAPLSVTFQSTSTGDVESLRWQRNGTTFSTVAQPTQVFSEGVYQVRLLARGRGGDEDTSASVTVTSFGDLTASFTPNNLEEIRSTTRVVNFVNQTVETPGIPLSYRWTLGNGNTSLASTPPQQSYTVSLENVTNYTVRLVASTAPSAPINCTGLGSTECSEAVGTFRFFPPANPSVAVSASSVDPRMITLTPSVLGDGTGTNPSYTFLRSSAGGVTPNIELGTFSNANPRTFNIATLGVYRFALRLTTNGPNGTPQVATSASVIQEVFADFSTDVFPIMTANCVSCHSSASGNCGTNGNLFYGSASPTALTIYNNIVDQPASFCTGTCGGQPTLLINSSSTNPNSSWLYKKLSNQAGSCGGVMPPLTTGLDAGDRAILESWIRGNAIF